MATKKATVEDKNRKDYVTDKWEQEVRESLTKKKTASVGEILSKSDKALVAAQVAKETDIRTHISVLQAKVKRGVELVMSLVASNTDMMQRYVGELAESLLVTAFGTGSFLLDQRPFEVFLVGPSEERDPSVR